jgi:hypothetical protein
VTLRLDRAGLILQRREGRQLFYSADFQAMNALVGYLTEHCCAGSGDACVTACKPVAAPNAAKRPRVA